MDHTRVAVPFVPSIKAGFDEARQCADQLTKLIEAHEKEGWGFIHLEDVTTLRSNGCLAGLAGNPTSVVTYQVAIFEARASESHDSEHI